MSSLNKIKEIDEIIALKCAFFYENKNLSNFFKLFEYVFHGVPWFLCVLLTYFFASEYFAAKAFILLIGKTYFGEFHFFVLSE